MHVLRLWAPLVASALAATGCSMAKFGYDALPTWAHWQVERYFSLDEQQREIVSRHLDELHRWHRRSQLPQYVAFLREVDDELRTPVDAGQIGRWRDRIGDVWTPLAERLAPGLAELALTLRPEQVERLRKRLREGNDEIRENHMPNGGTSIEEARADRVVKRAEFFLGRLGAAQVRDLRGRAGALPPTEGAWLAEREARQQRFVDLLERVRTERPTRAQATRWCRDYLTTMWHSREPHRRHRIEESIAASDELSAHTLARANAKQREHLSKLLRGYADDFETLSTPATVSASR